MKKPEGVYGLSIYGFEEPFRFEFHKAPDEKSETYLLDIPETEAALNIQVEFSDTVLSLTRVERREEPAAIGTDHEDFVWIH